MQGVKTFASSSPALQLHARPAGKCLQLLRPIRGKASRKDGIIITCADPVPGKIQV